jgi:DNA-binding transcriptional regulator YiaG
MTIAVIAQTIRNYHVDDDPRNLTGANRRLLQAIETDLRPCYEHLEACAGCSLDDATRDFIQRYEAHQRSILARYDNYEIASAALVRRLRQWSGLSKKDLARRIGVNARSILGYEIGTQTLSATRMQHLVTACSGA